MENNKIEKIAIGTILDIIKLRNYKKLNNDFETIKKYFHLNPIIRMEILKWYEEEANEENKNILKEIIY
jgi:hypothetical protein